MENQKQNTEESRKDYELLEETKKLRTAKSTLYVPKKDRYEDAMSSAYIFCIFGIIGDALAILSMLDIINLPIASNLFSQISMLILFTIFFLIGIVSWKKASNLKNQLGTEDSAKDTINTWLKENISKDTLDQMDDTDTPDEVAYLSKLDYIKEALYDEFSDYEEDLLDLLADEFLSSLYD